MGKTKTPLLTLRANKIDHLHQLSHIFFASREFVRYHSNGFR